MLHDAQKEARPSRTAVTNEVYYFLVDEDSIKDTRQGVLVRTTNSMASCWRIGTPPFLLHLLDLQDPAT